MEFGGYWAWAPFRAPKQKLADIGKIIPSPRGGIYHKVQVELTYNSNHIEGGRLSMDRPRLIFETATVGVDLYGWEGIDQPLRAALTWCFADPPVADNRRGPAWSPSNPSRAYSEP